MRAAILQSAATTGNGTSFQPDGRFLTLYIRGNGGVTAGAVTLEEDFDGTATTWAQIVAPITLTVGTNVVQVHHAAMGVYSTIRARISTNVTGGTVTVTAISD